MGWFFCQFVAAAVYTTHAMQKSNLINDEQNLIRLLSTSQYHCQTNLFASTTAQRTITTLYV